MTISPKHAQTALAFSTGDVPSQYQLLFLADFAAAKVLLDSILIGLAAQMIGSNQQLTPHIAAIITHMQASLDEIHHYPLWFEYVSRRDMQALVVQTCHNHTQHGHQLSTAYAMAFYGVAPK